VDEQIAVSTDQAKEPDMDTKESLAQLAAFPAELRTSVSALNAAQLRFRPAAGEWSAIEIVGHLIDVDEIWQQRVPHMISTDNPTLAPAEQDAKVRERGYQDKDLNNLLVRFAELRAQTIEMLRYITPVNMDKRGVHPVRGPITIADVFTIIPGHDQLHAQQIAANRVAFERATA
jgi:uncharacterized damage-inducible protein DinB